VCAFGRFSFSFFGDQVPEYPGKLFFFCETEAAEGGETPITLSHVVYERMLKEWPEFVAQLQDKGLLYTRNLADGDDLTSAIGRGWQSTFLTEDRVEAEKRFCQNNQTKSSPDLSLSLSLTLTLPHTDRQTPTRRICLRKKQT